MQEKAAIKSSFSKSRLYLDLAVLLVLTLLLFHDVLFVADPPVLSRRDTDLYHLFIHLRTFTFDQIRQGNLPLWNPYCFSGMPCLGSLQAAPLYPPNLIFLIPSPAHAVNGSIALHVFLMGVMVYLWVSHRGVHPLASLFSSVLAMFGGSHFLHVMPGSLPNLCAMVWAPLILLALDGWFERPSPGWILLGVFGVSMQILSGHPQYVFYTGVSASVYSGLHLTLRPCRLRALIGLPLIYLPAVMLTAVQLFPAFQTAGEGARAGGIPYRFAASASFPPENFITFLVPGFFGDLHRAWYWGRSMLWEMCPFFGVTGLVMCIYGSIRRTLPPRRFSVTMVLVLTVLALGGHTPLFRVLYLWVPGFDLFRGSSKFMFQASLFLFMLAGLGVDRLLRDSRAGVPLRGVILAVGLVLAAAALYVHGDITLSGSRNSIRPLMTAVSATTETVTPEGLISEPLFLRQASECARDYLALASLTCLLLWLLLSLPAVRRGGIPYVVLLGIVEMVLFAAWNRPTFPMELLGRPAMEGFLAGRPGDYRILYTEDPNAAVSLRVSNLWGYDTPLKRYAEFMAFTQGQGVEGANEYTKILGYHPLYGMLRCRFHFIREGASSYVREYDAFMPHLALIGEYTVLRERDRILGAMNNPDFDPRQTVILEKEPYPSPAGRPVAGALRILESSTDHFTLEADTPAPALLLITDPYSGGWRARALKGSVQGDYRILPANYVLMAVPLSAGRHSIRIEYLPGGFLVGRWVSILSGLAYLGTCAWCGRRARRPSGRGLPL